MSQPEPCTFLEWDSNFFQRRIARINGNRLDANLIQKISEWGRRQKIDCMYFLADPADSATVSCAEQWAAHFVDMRVTLRLDGTGTPDLGKNDIRPCSANDLVTLRSIARVSHVDGRFFFDPGFTPEQCRSLYEEWIARSYDGFAEAVLVTDIDGRASGYVTCHLDRATQSGRIGLFAVGEDARGLGIGHSLVNGAVRWFAGNGVHRIDVVTQGRNVAAQRLYAKSGFQIHSIALWYHKWFEKGQ